VHDPDLEWLLCVMPALMGESSGYGAIVAALERGQALGGGSPSSAGAEEAVERARPHVERSRRLRAIWGGLALQHRRVLEAHYYQPRSQWRHGVHAHLGELAGACKHLAPLWLSLELACSNAAHTGNAARIRRELGRAERAVAAAHRAWWAAKAAAVSNWMLA
jgi:hypothetical protein